MRSFCKRQGRDIRPIRLVALDVSDGEGCKTLLFSPLLLASLLKKSLP